MIFAALFESIGLAMVIPLLDSLMGSSAKVGAIGRLFDLLLLHVPQSQQFLVVCSVILVLFLLKNGLTILRIFLSARLNWFLREHYSSVLMEKYTLARYEDIIAEKQGIIVNNTLTEPNRAAGMNKAILDFCSKLTLIIALYLTLLMTNYEATIVVSILALGLWLSIKTVTRKIATHIGEVRLRLAQESTAECVENISAIKEAKIFNLQKKIISKFKKVLHKYSLIQIKHSMAMESPMPIMETVIIIVFVSTLFYINLDSTINISSTVPVVAMFFLVAQRLFQNVSHLISLRIKYLSLLPSLKLVYNLTKREIVQEDREEGCCVENITEDIIFKDIHFSYEKSDETLVFKNFNLSIPAGMMTAIVGRSGIGKSTIANLLLRLIDPEKGKILVNGTDIKEFNLKMWREVIGYVSQDPFIFNDTIYNNMLTGKQNASMDEVILAAKIANAHEFITNLPNGFETNVGDRGVKLSGGQKQRLSLAKAVIRNPDLYIFDEATSSLDTNSEKLIQESIEKLSKSKTVLVIAHRLSTIKNADVIYQINEAREAIKVDYQSLLN